jgi:hypothetical protein
LSKEQFAYTEKRIQALGLQGQVTLLLQDYRDLSGQYDKLVSIEMIEAVGHRFLPTYFKQCAQLLKRDGLMLLQAITIREQRFEQAKNSVDFIQRYIFPGGALPCVQNMLQIVSRDTDMNLLHMEDFGLHYARTLRLWHENFRRAHGRLTNWATTSISCGCGSFTCATARAVSWSAPSAPRNCCWPSHRPSTRRCSDVSVLKTLVNAALFQCGWFACVMGGNGPWLLVGLAALGSICCGSAVSQEGQAILAVTLLGTLIDTCCAPSACFTSASPGR